VVPFVTCFPRCDSLSDTTPVRFPYAVAVVAGDSMQPHLYAGDCVVVRRGRRARPGDVVLVHRPDRPELLVVKRVREVLSNGQIWLAGDNPGASDDSRVFGAVDAGAVEGRVVWRYRPLRRPARLVNRN
jgi:nickel-type superoxide dismutase maturation protease